MTRKGVLLCLSWLLFGPGALSWAADSAQPVRWKSGHEMLAGGGAGGKANAAAAVSGVLDTAAQRHVVLQFKSVPDKATRARLQARGVELLSYLGDHAFFAKVAGRKGLAKSLQAEGIDSASEIQLRWKQHPKLINHDLPGYARFVPRDVTDDKTPAKDAQDEVTALYVLFHRDVDLDNVGLPLVMRHGGTVRSLIRSINGVVAWIPTINLDQFMQEDAVQWAEPPLPPLGTNNDSNRILTQADTVQAAPYNLAGNGIAVMVYDGGSASASHPDFGGRLTVSDTSLVSDHATHVCGTVGGNGSMSSGQYRGMAPGVTLFSFGFESDGTGQFLYTNPGDMETDYTKAVVNLGAVIANNSIGTNVASNLYPCEWEGDYGVTDILIDSMIRGSLGQPIRVIWAAGNERSSGRCGVDYHTTAPPANAKNHITVGAVNSNNDTMTDFSSWGPTDDGRLKPDIVAPGSQTDGDLGVTSTVGSSGYRAMTGTSMAAPTVTGLCALLFQDWQARTPQVPLPSNALLKVLLTHNAADRGTPGPDYQFGYGSVRIADTINFARAGAFLEDTISNGDEKLFFIPVAAGAGSIKVTIAWDDPPGAVNTAPEVVNDIDVVVIAPGGTTYYPWTLDPAAPSSAAVRTKADHLNNIEQVVVDAPVEGIYTVMLTGYAIPEGPQAFAMAATPDIRSCASSGVIRLEAERFTCSSQLTVRVSDCDLDSDPAVINTGTVTFTSPTEPGGEIVTVTETGPATGTFQGSITLSSVNAPGVLQVSHADTITATYLDASDGLGNSNVAVTATATVDCQPPILSNISAGSISASSAVISANSNEPATFTVHYGSTCENLDKSVSQTELGSSFSLTISGLMKNTTYYYTIETADQAENSTTVLNGQTCFSFTTLDRQDYFTQMFTTSSPFDLDGKLLTLTPNGNLHFYDACLTPISTLPAKTFGATTLNVGDDACVGVALTGGKKVSLYGTQYGMVFVSPNGYITFLAGETKYLESYYDHFRVPRVSALFDDLNPPAGGRVSKHQLSDRLIITWENVPEYRSSSTNTFQVILHFNGQIQIAWSGIAAQDGLAGVSNGGGIPYNFVESDLSTTAGCTGVPGQSFDPWPIDLATNVSVTQNLYWGQGNGTTSHMVYFGVCPGPPVFLGTVTEPFFDLPVLANLTTYCWRIDEVNNYGVATGPQWQFTTGKLKPDFDQDGDVDMEDFAHLQLCFSGTDVAQTDTACQDAKLDADTDVDQTDADLLQGCLSGAQPANPACLP